MTKYDCLQTQGKPAEEEDREDGEIADTEKQVKAEEKKQKAREEMEAAKRELKVLHLTSSKVNVSCCYCKRNANVGQLSVFWGRFFVGGCWSSQT